MAITKRTRPPFMLTQSTMVKITRRDLGYFNMGRWVEGTPYEIEVDANVQPMQYKDLMQLDESDRTKEWIKLFSREEVRTAREGDCGWEADVIEWEGDKYKVMKSRHFVMGVLDHYAVMAARIPISAGPI